MLLTDEEVRAKVDEELLIMALRMRNEVFCLGGMDRDAAEGSRSNDGLAR